MTIADQITRLNNAKAAIKQSIENKGVAVSDTALLDEYPALIDSIEAGGGEGGNESYYEDLFNAITDNNTDYSYLFHNSKKTSIDVSNFDTSNVTDMRYMFYGCSVLTSLDVSNWDTSNVTNMGNMFWACYDLTSLDVSNWETSNVKDMQYVFNNCESLTSLDLSNWDTSNVTTMAHMFNGCAGLTSLDLSNWDTSKVTNITYIFNNCKSLTSLNLSNWDISKVTASYYASSAFGSCKALVDFQAPKNIKVPFDFSSSINLTHDSLMSIINNLATVTSTTKLTLGATNLAKLTDDEKAIATNKGWTLA